MTATQYIRKFEDLCLNDVPIVGGKNASLGEMLRSLKASGVNVPTGFATTATAYWRFLAANNLKAKITEHLAAFHQGKTSLAAAGNAIRRLFLKAEFPPEIVTAIHQAYAALSHHYEVPELDVAVRSSATAEDLPEASFAGQQETFLNVTGEKELLEACRNCYASLFTDRAISYREAQGFDHMEVALSIGVQQMVRSDQASAGVMLSIDPETGFPNTIVIDAAWGLGENVVKGVVTPDEYRVFKPLLNRSDLTPIVEKTLGSKESKLIYGQGGSQTTTNVRTSLKERQTFVLKEAEILQLARWAALIETHYGKPMDMEWAKDGRTGELYIVQARPETVQSQKQADALQTYSLKEKGERILKGLSVGGAIAAGKVCRIISAADIHDFQDNAILVTEMTDPDWVPVMKRAAGIVTNHGGRTCHAAIVSRELGIPAIVGTGTATEVLQDDQEITISCAEGDQGYVYQGLLAFEATEVSLTDIPQTQTQILLNIASPDAALRWWQLPCDGVGLARIEFIINNVIKIHPMALVRFDRLQDTAARRQIETLTLSYTNKTDYFVEKLAQGIAKIACVHYPNPVIVRTSDFKTNEYADLIGGAEFEPPESNPMLGFRGASRYYSDRYRAGFALECAALKRVREAMGFTNVIIMIPFCRTLTEADQVLEILAENGLRRGENGLEVYVMCEIPANIELATEFATRFDGFSIGSNDLTQLVLGVDRDSAELAHLFDERNPAVTGMIQRLLQQAHAANRKVGICGQAPSDYPDFATFLIEAGIDSISLNPDSVIGVKQRVATLESGRNNPESESA